MLILFVQYHIVFHSVAIILGKFIKQTFVVVTLGVHQRVIEIENIIPKVSVAVEHGFQVERYCPFCLPLRR